MASKARGIKSKKQIGGAGEARTQSGAAGQTVAVTDERQIAVSDADGFPDTVKSRPVDMPVELHAEMPGVLSEDKPIQRAPPVQYAGFWVRFLAAILDGLIMSLIITAVTKAFAVFHLSMPTDFEFTYFRSFILTGLYNILFIGYYGATPGKAIFGLRVVSAGGYKPVSYGVAFLREIPGKFISSFCLMIGYLWVAFDKRKQGWHDKIASTVVVYKNSLSMSE